MCLNDSSKTEVSIDAKQVVVQNFLKASTGNELAHDVDSQVRHREAVTLGEQEMRVPYGKDDVWVRGHAEGVELSRQRLMSNSRCVVQRQLLHSYHLLVVA